MKNWFKNIFAKKEKKEDLASFFTEVREGNNVALYDLQTMAYMNSQLPDPDKKSLNDLIKNANKIIVSKMSVNDSTGVVSWVPVYETSDSQTITEGIESVEVLDESEEHLMCIGNYVIEFISNNESCKIEYLMSRYIRIEEKFKNDAELKDPVAFLNWLNRIGISEPLTKWIEDEEKKKISKERFEKWKALASGLLLNKVEEINQDPFNPTISFSTIEDDRRWLQDLAGETPDQTKLILYLLKINGVGFHEWNPMNIYEMLPMNALLAVDIEQLNSAIENNNLDDEQKEGAAKLFSSWYFSKKRPNDIAKISKNVNDILLKYLENSENLDKINKYSSGVFS